MNQQLLDPVSAAEDEMAATARVCLIAVLDHSKAGPINITIDAGITGADMPVLNLPLRALHFFADVSRSFVIKEVEAGHLKCRLVNRHRRFEFEELVRYQATQKQRSEQALKKLRKV